MRVTNITELIWSHDLEALLRMCGEEEALIGCDASDYERFFAFCRSADLLHGNKLVHRITCFLSSLLQRRVSLCEETAEHLWRESAEVILVTAAGHSLWERFVSEDDEVAEFDVCPRCALSDFFDGNALLNTAQASWEAWRDEMSLICKRAFEQDFFGIFLTLPREFAFCSPHPYRVGMALMQKDGEDAKNLLLAQAFRFLSEECLKRNKTLLCRVECDGNEAFKLFSYAQAQVGLPRLIWSPSMFKDCQALFAFNGAYHSNAVECALQKRDYPTKESFEAALRFCADCYPLGKLQIIE